MRSATRIAAVLLPLTVVVACERVGDPTERETTGDPSAGEVIQERTPPEGPVDGPVTDGGQTPSGDPLAEPDIPAGAEIPTDTAPAEDPPGDPAVDDTADVESDTAATTPR